MNGGMATVFCVFLELFGRAWFTKRVIALLVILSVFVKTLCEVVFLSVVV